MDELADSPMIVRSARAGGFLRGNRAFLKRVGFCSAELAQEPLVEWIEEQDRCILQSFLENGEESCRVRHRTQSGEALWLRLQVRDQEEGPVVLGLCAQSHPQDVGDEAVQEEPTVKSTLHTIAQIVEEQNPGYKCSILLVAHGRFVKGAGPSLPDTYNNAIDGYAIGPTVGSCGTAIYWGTPVIVEDIQQDPLWEPFAELAREAGVGACWSHPFVSKGGCVLGALALYSPEPRTPTQEQLSRLRAAAQMTGLAVERGRAEEELRKANEVKARFMANMSHEIRTPLNALIGITDALQESATPEQEGLHEDLALLRESGEQLLELFTGVMELTESEGREQQGEALDLHDYVRRVCGPFEAGAKAKGLHFGIELQDSVPVWCRIDPWAFERCLGLLVDNAVKFTESGSVLVALGFEDHRLQVRVSDSGCGMALDRIGELRKPFTQGDLSTTKEYGGFGLGLALSDLCVSALGGELQFSANEPCGTRVEFEVPITPVEAPAQDPAKPTFTVGEGARLPVLVVEDNPLNRKVIEAILTRSGYEIELTENGEEAVEAMSRGGFSCVLMDCQMPVMDGYEATRQIRAMEAETGARIPIIAVTANALAEDRERCLAAGMDEYLKKPVRKEELVVALREFLRQSRPAA